MMRQGNLIGRLFQFTAVATAATAFFVGSNCLADEAHPASIVGVWVVKSHLVDDDQKESKSENEKVGCTFKFRKDGTWKAGERNGFLYWSYSESTQEMETWDTILGKKAKGTVCHYDVEFSKDGKVMTWKGRNMFGFKQKLVLEKK